MKKIFISTLVILSIFFISGCNTTELNDLEDEFQEEIVEDYFREVKLSTEENFILGALETDPLIYEFYVEDLSKLSLKIYYVYNCDIHETFIGIENSTNQTYYKGYIVIDLHEAYNPKFSLIYTSDDFAFTSSIKSNLDLSDECNFTGGIAFSKNTVSHATSFDEEFIFASSVCTTLDTTSGGTIEFDKFNAILDNYTEYENKIGFVFAINIEKNNS